MNLVCPGDPFVLRRFGESACRIFFDYENAGLGYIKLILGRL